MKFSLKLLLCTIVMMAAALGFCGFYFVNYVFETSLGREVGQAMDESSILGFAFETAALNVPMKYNVLQNSTVEEVALGLETGGQGTSRLIRISDEEKTVLYASDGFAVDSGLLAQTDETTKTWRIIQLNGYHYVHTAVTVNALDRVLYLETLQDISQVFSERALGFLVYRRVTVVVLIAGTIIMYLISSLLTKPIRILTGATRRMAEGDYAYRAELVSQDELGQLTKDFNHMAAALEKNIEQLEEEIQAREDFVAAFAHELKTPLTAIIGYADMLRLRKLDEEKSFLSANYIYTEGKRLEAMSFRLLEIMVTKRSRVEFQRVRVEAMFAYLKEMYKNKTDMALVYRYEEGTVLAEENLIKTVLVNLIDNACKASEQGNQIEISAAAEEKGYRFSVRDYGVGIPQDELRKITKAFYMVDKSRARSKNGAGLGLSLCVEILRLHNSELEIESVPDQGSCVSFLLSREKEERDAG